MSELNDNGGQVDIETFAKYLRLPITDTLQQLFNMYDTVSESILYAKGNIKGCSSFHGSAAEVMKQPNRLICWLKRRIIIVLKNRLLSR